MPKQTVTIEVDVPEGYVATYEGGCHRAYDRPTEPRSMHITLPLRRVWTPPAYLPEGCWVYRNRKEWYAHPDEPKEAPASGFVSRDYKATDIIKLAGLHSDTFTPPPVDKIQVRHKC